MNDSRETRRTFITSPAALPIPECEAGFPYTQLMEIMDPQQFARLETWLYGQTVALCDGRLYNYETREYESCCNGVAHGRVIYPHDVHRFLRGWPVID